MALFLVLQALLEPGRGDEVVILTPAWVSYKPMIELCGGKVVEVPCTFEDGFRPDPDAVAAAINKGDLKLPDISRADDNDLITICENRFWFHNIFIFLYTLFENVLDFLTFLQLD